MRKFSLLLFLITFSLFGQNSATTCELLSKINTLVQNEHYHPKPFDDSLSVYVFDTFIDGLDGNRNLFTKLEYEKLCKHRLLLDNYILQNDCSFMNDFVSMYKFALERKKKVLEKIQNEVLDYNGKDTVKFSKKNFPFELAATDFDRVWKKRMKFDMNCACGLRIFTRLRITQEASVVMKASRMLRTPMLKELVSILVRRCSRTRVTRAVSCMLVALGSLVRFPGE